MRTDLKCRSVKMFTDYYNRQNRWGNCGNDVRNRIIGNVLYDLPIGRGKLVNLSNPILTRDSEI